MSVINPVSLYHKVGEPLPYFYAYLICLKLPQCIERGLRRTSVGYQSVQALSHF